VSGAASSLETVTGASFVATVNLSGARAGLNGPLPIAISAAPDLPADVSVESQTPREVRVNMENSVREPFTVHVSYRKIAPSGLSYGVATVTPAVATVAGPESTVSKVVRLVVYGDDAVADEIVSPGTLDGFATIVPMDAQQNPVTGVEVVPDQAEVRIPVVSESAIKTLIVNANVVGAPAYPAQVTGVDVLPDRISVTGAPNTLATASVVDTDPVVITGATSDVTRTVNIELPAGLTASGSASVRVSVHIGLRAGTRTNTLGAHG
jgi:YbbR domain-containing protein